MRNSQWAVFGVIGGIAALIFAIGLWMRLSGAHAPGFSGERTANSYDYADFDEVDIEGQWQVTIERGDAWSVGVEAPAELADDLRVRVDDGVLRLDYERRWRFAEFDDEGTLQATITMPALESLDLSGASVVRFSGFEGESLSLDVSGAADIQGTASRFDELDLDASGALSVELGDVTVTDADVDVSGAGSITLRMAGGRLTGDLSGTASLEYYGTVSEERLDRSGFVNVQRRN